MNEVNNAIVSLLKEVGQSGTSGTELSQLSGISHCKFKQEAKKLWDQGFLSGIPEDGCCGRGCRFMCVSYMEEDLIWRLIE